ncbi:MAG TPA: metalloregulator ArsR/SmtB family transcription factor [Steroidobacteraceae bacterium]|jgi:DNA-binding transcriptional ArsR family regulator|nr:metalloregulator ArsR/SmtB family transcription factor [Steroidobacteraceae bacterium]
MVIPASFVYRRTVNAGIDTDVAISSVAAVIGEPTRARILVSLLDGRPRTGTELGAVAEVSPSTASVHLHRLAAAGLIAVRREGKFRYYSLRGSEVAALLERLSAMGGVTLNASICRAPDRLRAARTCYDHIAGAVGVALRERFTALGWLEKSSTGGDETYEVSSTGVGALTSLGIDLSATRALRRRFAFGCLDWTERRHHLAGALGAALLLLAQKKKWVVQDLDSRALRITERGRRELLAPLGVLTLDIRRSQGSPPPH